MKEINIKLEGVWVWIAVAVLVGFGVLIGYTFKAKAAPACMTLTEARAKYPTQHLWKTRGCWGLGVQRPRRVKPAPLPDIIPRVADAKAEVVVDANGADTFDVFNSFRERFVTFALADESKKADRLPLVFRAEPEPEPIPLPPIKPAQPANPSPYAWIVLLGLIVGLAYTIAYMISRWRGLLPPRSRFLNGGRSNTNVNRERNTFARTHRQPAAGRERAPAGIDGAGNQQPHFHSRDIYDWSGGTYERGHEDNPSAFDNRRDNTGALGAWARSRGLRPETEIDDAIPNNPRPGGSPPILRVGQPRKRFAIFAWR